MSKKNNSQQPTEQVQPQFVADLMLNGTTILSASSREELAEMLNDVPADVRYSAGAVGRSLDGSTYTLRIDLTKD